VNSFRGKDVALFVASALSFENVEVLNEDWGWGIVGKRGDDIIECNVADFKPGKVEFGGKSPADGPNWCIIIHTRVSAKMLGLFNIRKSTMVCETIGKELAEILMESGDKIISAEMEQR